MTLPLTRTRPTTRKRSLVLAAAQLAALTAVLSLAACSSSSDDATGDGDGTTGGGSGLGTDPGDVFAFVAGRTPTYDAGQVERFTLMPDGTIDASGSAPATLSDIVVRTDGNAVYEIGRYQLDTLTRYAPDAPDSPLYQYSVNGDETAANPYDIVFAGDDLAYIVRYGSPKVWIVNPSASSEAAFKLGELDLSAYDADGVPEATDALLVDNKLYILMERLTDFAPSQNGYVAVFDTVTNAEINTGRGSDGLLGIALNTRNPASLEYQADNQEILVLSRGNYFGDPATATEDLYSGGIETIDISDTGDYLVDMLLDDGTAVDNQGFFTEALVVDSQKGYLVTYAGFGDTTLREFNPTTGLTADGVVAGLGGIDITTLALDPVGRVWVGKGGADYGFTVIDPSDNSVLIEQLDTTFVPTNVVFVESASQD